MKLTTIQNFLRLTLLKTSLWHPLPPHNGTNNARVSKGQVRKIIGNLSVCDEKHKQCGSLSNHSYALVNGWLYAINTEESIARRLRAPKHVSRNVKVSLRIAVFHWRTVYQAPSTILCNNILAMHCFFSRSFHNVENGMWNWDVKWDMWAPHLRQGRGWLTDCTWLVERTRK